MNASHHQPPQNFAMWTVLVIIAVACFCLAWFAKPLHERWQNHRATQLISEARAILASDPTVGNVRFLEAVQKAQLAVGMVPEHIGAIRLSAELFTLMTRHEAIYFWEKLDRLGQSDLADTLGHVRALFLLGRQKEAEQLMGALLSASGSIQQG